MVLQPRDPEFAAIFSGSSETGVEKG